MASAYKLVSGRREHPFPPPLPPPVRHRGGCGWRAGRIALGEGDNGKEVGMEQNGIPQQHREGLPARPIAVRNGSGMEKLRNSSIEHLEVRGL